MGERARERSCVWFYGLRMPLVLLRSGPVPGPTQLQGNARHFAHVVAALILSSGLGDVFARLFVILDGFEIQTQIQMRVEQLAIELRLWQVPGTGTFESILGLEFALEKRGDLHHREPRLTLDRDERGAGIFQTAGSRDTKKMPDGVFHVVGVH